MLSVSTAKVNLPIAIHQWLRLHNKKRDVDPTWRNGISFPRFPRIKFFAQRHRSLAPNGPSPILCLAKVDSSDTGKPTLTEGNRSGPAEDLPTEQLEFGGDHDTGGVLDDAESEQNFDLFCQLRKTLSDAIAAK